MEKAVYVLRGRLNNMPNQPALKITDEVAEYKSALLVRLGRGPGLRDPNADRSGPGPRFVSNRADFEGDATGRRFSLAGRFRFAAAGLDPPGLGHRAMAFGQGHRWQPMRGGLTSKHP